MEDQDQHEKPAIKGYRELSHEDINLINYIKEKGADLGRLVETLRNNPSLDPRWISIGATHLQEGLMALTRAIAKPTFFCWAVLVLGLLAGCTSEYSRTYHHGADRTTVNVTSHDGIGGYDKVTVSKTYKNGKLVSEVRCEGSKEAEYCQVIGDTHHHR